MATVVTLLGVDVVSGRIIEELPDLAPQGSLGSLLGAYTSTAFRLPIPLGGYGAAPRNWLGATEAGRTMIVAVLAGRPVWAGLVLIRKGGTGATADLGTVSLEGYLARRYVRDHELNDMDEALIASTLVDDANIEGIGFAVDAPPTGTLRDRTYLDQSDKPVYSALQELMGVRNGPEWTVALDWTDATETAVTKIVRVRKRIGYSGSTPTAVFTTGTAPAVASSAGASEARYEFTEDYSDGSGANHILATSADDSGIRIQSTPARDEALLAAGWPRYEHRFSPSSGITRVSTLDAHAQQALEIMARGARPLTVTARADVYPVLGTDWSVGDNIGFDLIGHRHPAGVTGVARAIGWDLDTQAGTITPILLPPSGEVIS